MTNSIKLLLASVTSSAFLIGCGGGGGSQSTSDPRVMQPPVSTAPTFTQGVFAPSSNFVDQCETPRTGVDPLSNNGAQFSDRDGSTLQILD